MPSFLFLNTEQKRGITMQTITLEQEQILPAPSNSRLSVQNLPIYPKTLIQELPQEIEKVSIDKLVIAANLNPYLVQSLITNFCNEPNIVFQGTSQVAISPSLSWKM